MKMFGLCVSLWLVGGCSEIGPICEPGRTACGMEPGLQRQADAAPAQPSDVAGTAAPKPPPAMPQQVERPTPQPDASVDAAAVRDDDAGTNTKLTTTAIDKVDLLFVVDNTNSMIAEQASLKAALPKLMVALTTGVSSGAMPAMPAFAGIADLHVGVVSTDMGIAGVEYSSCHANGGDDGRLLHSGHDASCAESYPSFLSYAAKGQDVGQLAQDFACIAALGTGGCGFEQSLEAPLKALWPSKYIDAEGSAVTPNPVAFLTSSSNTTQGRGDLPAAEGGNAGFLRNDPQSRSLIAIVVVTDEDDCSVIDPNILKPDSQLPVDSPYREQDVNLRCHENPNALYTIDRYLKNFRKLREGDDGRVVFAAIAGVPADLVEPSTIDVVDFTDETSRNAFYDHVLSDPRMQATVDPSTLDKPEQGGLLPSCNRKNAAGEDDTAAPPRRIVELAQRFGPQGIIQSICQDDFTPATDAIVGLIGRQLNASRH